MFKVKVTGDKAFKRKLQKFGKIMDLTQTEIVVDMAKKGGLALARQTEPYGLTGKAKKLSENAAERDVRKIYANIGRIANLIGKTSRRKKAAYLKAITAGKTAHAERIAKQAIGAKSGGFDGGSLHESQRKRGAVPRGGYEQTGASDQAKVSAYSAQKQAMSGLAKSGWFHAVNDLKGKKPKFQKWITRHKKHGKGKVRKRGNKTTVTLTNTVNYISNVLTDAKIKKALANQTRNTLKYYDKVVSNHTKKI